MTPRKKQEPRDWSRLTAWVFVPLVTLATIVAIFLGVNNQNVLKETRRQFDQHGRDVQMLIADVEALIKQNREGAITHNSRMRREHAALLTCLKDLDQCDPAVLEKILNGDMPAPPLVPNSGGGTKKGPAPAPSPSPSSPGNPPGPTNPPGPNPPPIPPGLCIDVIGCLPNLPESLQPPGLT